MLVWADKNQWELVNSTDVKIVVYIALLYFFFFISKKNY